MEQINLFQVLYEKYHMASKRCRLIELFGGIGSQAKSLEILQEEGKLPLGFEHYRLVEFDKYPVASYNAVHGTNFVPTDITKIHASDLGIVERDKFNYIMTYSFPCQDISGAGKMKGFNKDNQLNGKATRSGLLWEVERLLNECGTELPQILLLENVKNLVSKRFKPDFEMWLKYLESRGYTNFYNILNAKDYGIPQNRERVFCVSILNSSHGEKYFYEFPKAIPLKLKLKDMLEDEVDEKYYLSKKMIASMTNKNTKGFNRAERFYQTLFNTNVNGIASTITTCAGSRPTDNFIVNENDLSKIEDVLFIDGYNRKIKNDGISGTITSGVSFRNQEFIAIKNNNKKGYEEAYEGDSISLERLESKTRRGRVGHEVAQTLMTDCNQGVVVKIGNYSPSGHSAASKVDSEGIAPTVMENHGTVTATNVGLRIRKLTPRECWRLIGWNKDSDFDKAAKVNSNSQLYKQAGNSIVVNCLVAIFSQLL